MPFTIPSYPILTPEQANPIMTGLHEAVKMQLERAQAKSAMAYANLMGPQLFAKLLEHDPAFRSLTGSGQAGVISGLSNVASGMNGAMNVNQEQPSSQSGNPLKNLTNGISELLLGTSIFGNDEAQPRPLAQSIQQYQSNGNQQTNAPSPAQQVTPEVTPTPAPQVSASEDTSPQGTAGRRIETGKQVDISEAEAKEAGKIRANQIKDLESDYKGFAGKQFVLDNVKNDLLDPIIKTVRTNPLMGAHEMAWFAKEGNSEQQNLVGKFGTDINNLITSSIKEFGSRLTNADLNLLQDMKISKSDTLDAAIGKYEALASYNEYMARRSGMTAKLMQRDRTLSETAASKQVDKVLKGNDIRTRIHKQFYPTIVEHDGKKYKETEKGWMPL